MVLGVFQQDTRLQQAFLEQFSRHPLSNLAVPSACAARAARVPAAWPPIMQATVLRVLLWAIQSTDIIRPAMKTCADQPEQAPGKGCRKRPHPLPGNLGDR